MKRHLLFASLCLILLSSCRKDILIQPVDPVTGNWVLSDAARLDDYGWTNFSSGVEQGIFYFYADGRASYSEPGTTMQGNWNIQTVSGSFYDENGNYRYDIHEEMSIQLADYGSDDRISMYFDYVRIYGSTIIATTTSPGFVDRYRFVRY